MRRRSQQLSLLARVTLALGAALAPGLAAAQAPDGPKIPGEDAFDIRYYVTDADGDRARALASQDLTYYFYNQARCECGHRIEAQIRLLTMSGVMYDLTKNIEAYVGPTCATAEVSPVGQFRKCAQVAVGNAGNYQLTVHSFFHPVFLTNGVALDSPTRRPEDPTTLAAGSCNGPAGEAGVWMCAPLLNGMSGCQADDFFITGTKNSSLPMGMASGITYDFQAPINTPEAITAEPGDSAVVVSWELAVAGEIAGFRVLCEDAETGMPAGSGVDAPALSDPQNGTLYFTKNNLCGDKPFFTYNSGGDIGVDSSALTLSGGDTASAGDTDTDGLDTDGVDTDTGGVVTTCGDGVMDDGEECDDGENNGDTAACLTDCTKATCGDGKVQEGVEDCDDANFITHDDCTNDCKAATCGDGIWAEGAATPAEECDLGANNGPTSLCLADCTIAPSTCGNMVAEIGEACDGASPAPNPANLCMSCVPELCGDSMVQAPEQCDGDGACTPGCTINACGDGIQAAGEGCDDGYDNSDAHACTSTCTLAVCGDGKVQSAPSDVTKLEECDDGSNNGDDKPCTNACLRNVCGDGKTGPGEECDDGDANGDDQACTSTCTAARCGDGKTGPGEECDDGSNNGPTKLCKDDCTLQGSDGLRELDWSYVCTDHLGFNTKSARIEGLENGRRYNFLLVAYDKAGNPVPATELVTAAPVNTRDLWEQCHAEGDVCGESGFCNVAGRSDRLLALGALLGLGLGLGGLVRRRRAHRKTRA